MKKRGQINGVKKSEFLRLKHLFLSIFPFLVRLSLLLVYWGNADLFFGLLFVISFILCGTSSVNLVACTFFLSCIECALSVLYLFATYALLVLGLLMIMLFQKKIIVCLLWLSLVVHHWEVDDSEKKYIV